MRRVTTEQRTRFAAVMLFASRFSCSTQAVAEPGSRVAWCAASNAPCPTQADSQAQMRLQPETRAACCKPPNAHEYLPACKAGLLRVAGADTARRCPLTRATTSRYIPAKIAPRALGAGD